MTGKLYLVATPIGNLSDMTFRAIETLNFVDLIACEDTRRTKILLSHYKIQKPLLSCNAYNQKKRLETILKYLESNKNVAYVSDSGTPGISDPGELLVKTAIENNIPVECIPGPTAFVTALVCSGLPTDKFVFLGFLPRKPGKIKKILTTVSKFNKTIIFFESPYRIIKTLTVCKELFSDAKCVLARELTKKFEEYIRGTINSVLEEITNRRELKGELIVMISNKQ